MMSQSTTFIVLVAALLLSTLSWCFADNVYCVIPTLSANTSCSSCPRNSTHCATLSEYAQEANFTSNTTMVFQPGDHTLDINITAANISRLTMCGESSSGYVARVVCNESVGFSFTSMVDFKTHSLSFTSCGRKFGNYFKATMLLESIENAELVNCSFQGSLGTALAIYNTNITLAENSEFTQGGGGVAALDSNLLFIGNTTFIGNNVSVVINVTNCSLSSAGSVHFISNSNTEHRAVAIWASTSSLNFTGTSNFVNNSGLGGAIYAFNSTYLSFNGNSTFISNSAAYSGGAILVRGNTSLYFAGTSNFIDNSDRSADDTTDGGAISASHNVSLSFTGTSNFINNSAFYGGAISASHNVSLSFTGTNNFINNSAFYGCAISASHNVSFSFTGTSNFINNKTVGFGGAISSSHNVSLSFTGASNFINNSAFYGGAISSSHNVSLSFTGTSNFINNSAYYGGAISASHNVSFSFTGTSNFINNSAPSGGAISVLYSVWLSFTGTSNFVNNSAGDGGAILASSQVCLSFTGTSNFIRNSGNGAGGGIFLSTSSFSILPNTTVYWENNRASYGGAIYVDDYNPFIYCAQIETKKDKCFFQLPGQNLSNGIDVQFVFKDNCADAGDVRCNGSYPSYPKHLDSNWTIIVV